MGTTGAFRVLSDDEDEEELDEEDEEDDDESVSISYWIGLGAEE
jgi:hypothetical protein